MIIIGGLIDVAVFYYYKDIAFSLIFVWVLIEMIGVRHGYDVIFVTLAAWIVAALIIFSLGWITVIIERKI